MINIQSIRIVPIVYKHDRVISIYNKSLNLLYKNSYLNSTNYVCTTISYKAYIGLILKKPYQFHTNIMLISLTF